MKIPSLSLSDIHWERMRPLPALVAGFVLLIALTLALLMLIQRAQIDSERAITTITTINQLSDVVAQVRRAESSQRGFLITNDPQYLADFEPSADAVNNLLSNLRPAWRDGTEMGSAFSALSGAAEDKITELRKTVATARAGDRLSAVAHLKENAGFRLMNQIETNAGNLIAGERESLVRQSASSSSFSRLISAAGLLAMALTLAIAGISLITLQRSLNQMTATHTTIQQLNSSLEQTVTERTRNLIEANQEIQNFASTVSHDLRSPLVNIMGFTSEIARLKAELLQRLTQLREQAGGASADDKALGDEIDEALDFIKSSTTRMDMLINAILAIAREGNRELRPEPVDMTALVKSLADTHAHHAQKTGLEIAVEDLPPVTSDRLALEQVFGNLVDNAVKFLRPDVPGRIRIRGHPTTTRLFYEVEDNGRGIDPKDRTRIFAPFRRAGVLDRPGDGIGLAHVRSLTRRLGGTIRFRSQLGAGATFIVELPKEFTHPDRESADS